MVGEDTNTNLRQRINMSVVVSSTYCNVSISPVSLPLLTSTYSKRRVQPPPKLFVRSHCRKLRTNKKNTLRRRKMSYGYNSAHLPLFMVYQYIILLWIIRVKVISILSKKKERNTRYYYSGLLLSLNPTPFRKNYIIIFGWTSHMLLKLLHIIPQI